MEWEKFKKTMPGVHFIYEVDNGIYNKETGENLP
jgi:hypothetical protein